MGGTNDVAGNDGPESDNDIENALSFMVDDAVANNVEVILAAIPPAKQFAWRPDLEPAQRIKSLNARLEKYAASRHITFVDYWTAMAGPDGGMRSELSADGVHPNTAGYAVMASRLQDALRQIESKGSK